MAKNLKEFLNFDAAAFFAGKVLVVTDVKTKYAYVDGKRTDTPLGQTVEVAIVVDKTNYAEGVTQANLYEKVNLTVISLDDLGVVTGDVVAFDEVLKANVWGDFQNNLSITVDGLHKQERK